MNWEPDFVCCAACREHIVDLESAVVVENENWCGDIDSDLYHAQCYEDVNAEVGVFTSRH